MTVKKIVLYYSKSTLAKHLEQIMEELMTLTFSNVKFVVVCFRGEHDERVRTIVHSLCSLATNQAIDWFRLGFRLLVVASMVALFLLAYV